VKTGLLAQLDAYYSQVEDAQDPIEPDEIAALVAAVRELPIDDPGPLRHRSRPKAWIALVAAAVALVLLGALPLLLATGEETPPATTPSTMTTTTVPTPSTTLDEESSTTLEESTRPSPTRQTVTAVPVPITVPEILVGDGPTVEWFDVSDTMPPSSRAVHVSGGRFYLPGLVDGRFELHSDTFTSVWVSDDGLTWEQYPIHSSAWVSARELQFHDMTLAYAVDHSLAIVDLSTGDVSTVYTFDEPINDLAYGDMGIVVSTAGHRKYDYEYFFDTVIVDEVFRESIGSAGIEDGIFYVGTDTEERQWVLADYGFEESDFDYIERMWHSTNGVEWTLVRDHGEQRLGNEGIGGYVATDRGFFATAWTFEGTEPLSENVWYSPDGIDWIDQGCCTVGTFGTWNEDAIGQHELGPLDELVVSRRDGVARIPGLPADDFVEWARAGTMIVGIQWRGEYPGSEYPLLYFSFDGEQWSVHQPAVEGGRYDFFWHWNGYFPAGHVVATDTTVLLTTFGHDEDQALPPWRWLGIVRDG
jgi:hypothetical protein